MRVVVYHDLTRAEHDVVSEAWPDLDYVVLSPGASDAVSLLRSAEVLIGSVSAIDALVGPLVESDAGLLSSLYDLRLINVLGHGTDLFEGEAVRAALRANGIRVARTSSGSVAVAEYCVMCMLALSRHLIRFHNRLAFEGDWSQQLVSESKRSRVGAELAGSTLGIVGYGGVGRSLHERALALGMRVGVLSRSASSSVSGIAFRGDSKALGAFLNNCDYVVVAAPLTPETKGMFGADAFSAMKDRSYFVNVSRGGLVDEPALWAALASGKLSGAALDVWSREDQEREFGVFGYPASLPIHQFNVIMTPHCASATENSRIRGFLEVGKNLHSYVRGEALELELQFKQTGPG